MPISLDPKQQKRDRNTLAKIPTFLRSKKTTLGKIMSIRVITYAS